MKQVHLCLQQVALRLRDKKRRRQAGVVAALFGFDPLIRECRARPRSVDALGGAPDLAARLPDCFGRLQPQARDSLGRLTAFDFGSRAARFLEAAP